MTSEAPYITPLKLIENIMETGCNPKGLHRTLYAMEPDLFGDLESPHQKCFTLLRGVWGRYE